MYIMYIMIYDYYKFSSSSYMLCSGELRQQSRESRLCKRRTHISDGALNDTAHVQQWIRVDYR